MTTPLTRSQTIPRLPRSVGISPSAQLEGLPPTASHQEQLLPKRSALDEASLRKIIRDMGLKVTDQRLLILKALHTGRAHVTAQEVFETVSNKDSSIGFATVYRFLRSLTESGFVTEVRLGGSSARYELKPEGHGKICEIENSQIENLQARVAEQFGFQLTGHVLELYGVCYDCQ
jgi:Fur family ferric uptake transcriptional regulator